MPSNRGKYKTSSSKVIGSTAQLPHFCGGLGHSRKMRGMNLPPCGNWTHHQQWLDRQRHPLKVRKNGRSPRKLPTLHEKKARPPTSCKVCCFLERSKMSLASERTTAFGSRRRRPRMTAMRALTSLARTTESGAENKPDRTTGYRGVLAAAMKKRNELKLWPAWGAA